MRTRARVAIAAAIAVLAGLLVPLTAGPADAAPTTIFVGPTRGDAFDTIQEGIVAAANGDTVSVDQKPGGWTENFYVQGKYITLKPTSGTVTIRSGNSNPVLQFLDAPSNPTYRNEVYGFTFTGGNSRDGQGGAMTIYNSSPDVHDMTFEGNTGRYGGGILVFRNSNPFIHDNIIRNNVATDGGGGIAVIENSAPVIVDNQITGNTTVGWTGLPGGGSSGAGIYLLNDSANASAYVQPIVLGNNISNNTADFAGGGLLVGKGINVIAEDNTIDSNTAAYGGGIHIESVTSQPVIDSNRITNNQAITTVHSGAGQGGGISIFDQSRPTINNNTITGNRSAKGGGGITAAEYSNSTISSNFISSNTTGKTGDGSNADGGGLYVAQASVTVVNNVFLSNAAENNGGGIAIVAMVVGGTTYFAKISHNTIARSTEPSVWGGGIYVGDSAGSQISITNNILTLNQGAQLFEPVVLARIDNNILTSPGPVSEWGGGLYYNYTDGIINSASILNSNAHINAANNLSSAAGFVNVASNDFRLTSTSPAIGAATGTSVPPVTLDIRGVARSATFDIGAYEYAASPVVVASPVLSGTPEVSKSLLVTAGTWGPTAGAVSYQWFVDGAAVAGATSNVFLPRVEDVGKPVNVVVTVTKYGVYTRSFTSNITTPVQRGPYFADVPTSQPFYSPIMWMKDNGISTGSPNAPYAPLFKPVDGVTRQAMALFLYRMSGETFVPPTDATFADVPVDTNSPFYTAIEWMAARGISTGTPQGTPEAPQKPLFKPADVVTRESMGIFLARFAHADLTTPPTAQSFADVPLTASSAAALGWMKTSGISTGTPQPTGLPLYKPQDPVSRQALSAFLFRLASLP